MSPRPPRPALLARLILSVLPLGPRRPEIERDLEIVFEKRIHRAGRHAARRRYWRELRALAWWRLAGGPLARPDHLRSPREVPMKGFVHDVRYGARGLLRRPGYTTLAIVTLALGIGATTSMFTVVHGVLLSPLPVREPERLMAVWEITPRRGDRTVASAANYADWRDANDSFDELAILAFWGPTLSGVDEPRRLSGRLVSANFLRTMGVEPRLGRDFRDDEDQSGADPVVMLSENLWEASFQAAPDIVGSTIKLSTGEHIVIGVAPRELQRAGPGGDILAPLILEDGDWLQFRGRHNVNVYGRLAPGITAGQAQVDMGRIAAHLEQEYPESNQGYGIEVQPLHEAVVGSAARPLVLLQGAVGFVLLIACANVANLTLAQGVSRRGELAICAALGAGRRRLLRRLIIESSLLAGAGAALGIGLSALTIDAMLTRIPAFVPRLSEVSINGTVLGFGVVTTLATVLLSGMLPAVRATGPSLRRAMSGADPRATVGRADRRVRDALVVAELALAVVLLVGAGLFLRSLAALGDVDLGVRSVGTMTLRTYLPADPYGDPELARAAASRALEATAALPNVEAAAIASHLPLAGRGMTAGFTIEGGAESGASGPQGSFRIVSAGYFAVLGVPLLEGRGLAQTDRVGQPLVALVNRALADLYFPEGAVGRRIAYRDDAAGNDLFTEIVGVVGNVRHFGPAEPPVPEIYEPLGQTEETLRWVGRSLALVARSAGPPEPLGRAMREIIRDVDPALPVYQVQQLDAFLDQRTSTPRFHARILSIFGGLAVLLAAVGVYGALSLNVRLRLREIGLRQALGADRGAVVRAFVGDGFKLAAAGTLLGLVVATALARLISSLLYGVSAFDPTAYLAAPVVLAAVAGLACWLPARRAARIDPLVALRDG